MAKMGRGEARGVFKNAKGVADRTDWLWGSPERRMEKWDLLETVAISMSEAGFHEDALEFVFPRGPRYCAVACALAQNAPYERAVKLADTALKEARAIYSDVGARASALSEVAISLAVLGQVERAVQLTQEIPIDSQRFHSLETIAREMAKRGHCRDGLHVLKSLLSQGAVAGFTISAFLDSDCLQETLHVLQQFGSRYMLFQSWAIERLARKGRHDEAIRILEGVTDPNLLVECLLALGEQKSVGSRF